MTSDVGFVFDRLATLNRSGTGRFSGRLDLLRVGIVGHSLGGATAAQFCHDDRRCAAGVDIDGTIYGSVVRDGLQQPFLFLLSDHGQTMAAADRQAAADVHSVFDRLPQDRRVGISVSAAHHFSFTDTLLLRSQLLRGVLRLGGALGIEPRRGLAITTASSGNSWTCT